MSDHDPKPELDGPQRPARHAGDDARGAAGNRDAGTVNEPPEGLENPQTARGGADDVQKTSYVTGKGTDPDAKGP